MQVVPRTGRSGSVSTNKSSRKEGEKKEEGEHKFLDTDEALAYERQLESWVLTKLNKWENDSKFRKKRKKKFSTKTNFEKYLRDKSKQQLKAATGIDQD
eukprot:g4309.t1